MPRPWSAAAPPVTHATHPAASSSNAETRTMRSGFIEETQYIEGSWRGSHGGHRRCIGRIDHELVHGDAGSRKGARREIEHTGAGGEDCTIDPLPRREEPHGLDHHE